MNDKLRIGFDLAMRLKAAMIAKKKDRAWTKCPICGKKVTAVLAGPKRHIHASCETKNCLWIME